MAPLLRLVTNPDNTPNNVMYFWLTGALSSFLDNAPTYLIFFNSAGGDADTLQNALPTTLLAISAGAVFMGANSYIGNAPNFMVKSIAQRHDVPMPSFFGYMLWSAGFLLPLFGLLTIMFFTLVVKLLPSGRAHPPRPCENCGIGPHCDFPAMLKIACNKNAQLRRYAL